jgi:hypothetical protein
MTDVSVSRPLRCSTTHASNVVEKCTAISVVMRRHTGVAMIPQQLARILIYFNNITRCQSRMPIHLPYIYACVCGKTLQYILITKVDESPEY